jgi:protein-S-isoprenylcysteine O-methyltransferase Ste14
MSVSFAARPNILPWPPMLYLAAFLLAFAFGHLYPIATPHYLAARFLGYLSISGGAAFDFWAAITLHRERTTILPHRAATSLVTRGPFQITRNPIYVGNTIAIVGLALAMGSAWLIVFGLVAAILVDRLAIQREEIHLSNRFGEAWALYRSHTPRWLGRIR